MGKPIEIKTKEEFIEIFGQPSELTEDQKKLITENIQKGNEYTPFFVRRDEVWNEPVINCPYNCCDKLENDK